MQTHHLDLNDPDFIRDPYPRLEDLREHTPVFLDETWNKVFFTRYADIAAILRDRRFGRSILHVLSRDELGWPPPNPAQAAFDHFQAHHILDMEPPGHTRLRALVQKAFTAQRVESLRGRVEGIVNDLLDRVEGRGGMDVHDDLAEPLPVAVIAELLGVPEPDRHLLRPWSAAIVKLYELGYGDDDARAASTAVTEFSEYLRALARDRRANPRDDLITALVRVEEQGERLSEDELIANCILLLNAGHEATVNGTTAAVLNIARHPHARDQLARAAAGGPAADPIWRSAVEEFLRFDTPLPMFERWVLEDVTVHGVPLERGQEVALLYASGNRDPRRFTGPDRLDLERADNAHLSFGLGTHYCIGAPLARLEMSVALHALMRRHPRFELAADRVAYGAGFVIRGLTRLPIAF